MNKNLLLSLAFLIVFLGGALYIKEHKDDELKTVTFRCAQSKYIVATFNLKDDKFVNLFLSDGAKLIIPRAVSASGARYATADDGFVFWNKGDTAFITESGQETYSNCLISQKEPTFDGKNSTFTIDGRLVTLVNGVATESIPNSSSKITTRYFGNEAIGDLNGDGMADEAYLVTQDMGGSGVFYYVVVAMKTKDGYKTTNAFLIGDRIAPQSTEIHSDSRELHVNFAERRKGEPMTAQPSQGAVLLLKVTPQGVLEGLMK